MRNIVAMAMAVLLLNTPHLQARAGPLVLKSQLVEIPTGSLVQITMLDKKKLRGKLGMVSDEAFEIQSIKSGRIEMQSVRIDEAKSVKVIDTASRRNKAGYIVVGIVVGAAAALVIIVFAIRGAIH